jgi:predicted DNA-binding transcriptional regulator YafY
MSRAERLLALVQCLRRHRHPVSGAALAVELSVSLRTLYRDIATLQRQGAPIDGAPGLGYVLKPGWVLPPLMFSEDELEALVLGMRWVASRSDGELAAAGRDALAKIEAVLPPALKREAEASTLMVGSAGAAIDLHVREIRQAIRGERRLHLAYRDRHDEPSERAVWPFALGFFDHARVVAAWCELRGDFRHFRTDRIAGVRIDEARYPRRRHELLRDWRQAKGIGEPAA